MPMGLGGVGDAGTAKLSLAWKDRERVIRPPVGPQGGAGRIVYASRIPPRPIGGQRQGGMAGRYLGSIRLRNSGSPEPRNSVG